MPLFSSFSSISARSLGSTSDVPFSATGGTVTTAGGYTTHEFTSSGTFTILRGSKPLELMVVAGGGGGGGRHGGGAGGGGVVYHATYYPSQTGAYTITVGSAGAVSDPNPAIERSRGFNGGYSLITTPTGGGLFYALGGAGGGSYSAPALSGGCGGGGAGMQYMSGSSEVQSTQGYGPTGRVLYGQMGGNGNTSTEGGGGGGASLAGLNAGPSSGGNGGNGITLMSITVSGGGGGGSGTATAGTGGTGGGGNGGASGAAGSAATYYGGGGGGSRSNPATNQAGVGYQGIVRIKYAV